MSAEDNSRWPLCCARRELAAEIIPGAFHKCHHLGTWPAWPSYLSTLGRKCVQAQDWRGGVMGGSASATIPGIMVRGSSDLDDNTIMMAPGHVVGFGLFTNATIDQNVRRARPRERPGARYEGPSRTPRPRREHLHHRPRRHAHLQRPASCHHLGPQEPRRPTSAPAIPQHRHPRCQLVAHPPDPSSHCNCPPTGSGEHRAECGENWPAATDRLPD
jgi:hypothetical protein